MDLLLRLSCGLLLFSAVITGRNPCCSGPTASTRYTNRGKSEEVGRNPCCSGPTASTRPRNLLSERGPIVAIPVVVDLLLRPSDELLVFKGEGVAIPVVVDLLLRP